MVVCAGGGGIPTMYEPGTRNLIGVEAVIDKDLASYVLARDLDADLLVIATDTASVFLDWGAENQRAVTRANPDALVELGFAAGSMGPKVEAAAAFANETGKTAAIGSLDQLEELIEGNAGTHISTATTGIETD